MRSVHSGVKTKQVKLAYLKVQEEAPVGGVDHLKSSHISRLVRLHLDLPDYTPERHFCMVNVTSSGAR